jgi:hypothetical protein
MLIMLKNRSPSAGTPPAKLSWASPAPSMPWPPPAPSAIGFAEMLGSSAVVRPCLASIRLAKQPTLWFSAPASFAPLGERVKRCCDHCIRPPSFIAVVSVAHGRAGDTVRAVSTVSITGTENSICQLLVGLPNQVHGVPCRPERDTGPRHSVPEDWINRIH